MIALYRFLADRASPAVAERYTTAIVAHCRSLATMPHRGTRRDEIRAGLRTVGYGRRVTIAFDVAPDAVNILGVYYGGRDYESDFRFEDD